jgi:hypothetical protein
MNYCHLTDATWNPRPLPSRFGEISENYFNSDTADILRDGWRVAVPATVEAGARYASAVAFTDAEAREVATITATAAQVAAEQAASEATAEADAKSARMAEIVPLYGPAVGMLAQLLAAFGLEMPITAPVAMPAVYAKWKSDDKLGPDATMLLAVYSQLNAVLSDDDIYAIGKAIGVAK